MSKKSRDFFWLSYADVMTSMFFVMLVLYVVSFVLYQQKINELNKVITELGVAQDSIKIVADKYKIIETVEKNLEPLKKDSLLFSYNKQYKRYSLTFQIEFEENRFVINEYDLKNYKKTIIVLNDVSSKLKEVITKLERQKKDSVEYKNISYLIVVSGSASDLKNDNTDDNYLLSFKRAYYLYKYWKEELDIDFDAPKYHDLIDFQIAGNGIGGVGRFPNNSSNNYASERKNQRFLINIIPKIGELE